MKCRKPVVGGGRGTGGFRFDGALARASNERLLPERHELHVSEVGRQAIDLAHRASHVRFQAVSFQPACQGGETFGATPSSSSFDMICPIHSQDSASPTYAVGFPFGGATPDPFHPAGSFVNLAPESVPLSIDVSNTTYDYYSMRNGDLFESAFPTTPGSFLKLDVAGYSDLNGTGAVIGDVSFYLANFLSGNAYIVDAWQTVDLSSLAGDESLAFGLQSSSNDPNFGMNTPAFFAADDLRVTQNGIVPEPGAVVQTTLVLLAALGLYWRSRRMCAAV